VLSIGTKGKEKRNRTRQLLHELGPVFVYARVAPGRHATSDCHGQRDEFAVEDSKGLDTELSEVPWLASAIPGQQSCAGPWKGRIRISRGTGLAVRDRSSVGGVRGDTGIPESDQDSLSESSSRSTKCGRLRSSLEASKPQ
jgi:hypothetical protein